MYPYRRIAVEKHLGGRATLHCSEKTILGKIKKRNMRAISRVKKKERKIYL